MVRSRGRRRQSDEDDDDEDRHIRKKGANPLVMLAVGAGGGLLLICLLGCGIGAVIALLPRDDTAEKLPGSWKGRFVLARIQLDVAYIFNKDGSFRQESFDRFGRRVNVADGRWRYRDGRVEIDWNNGTFERATVAFLDDNTMTYVIVDHSQGIQVGLTTTFRRQ